ncbi:cell wall-binding repeat-containing protein [Hamadaea tsunoensis]|uniref:cell wall-binding repeat-containing protein n=1 Tax=Hamadaea tsunoensis TaxID=53368 RepID=UPI0004263CCC|nr:cell wall-binding repeat-containing protein [Hamadaea tsunoensis]
MRTQLARQRAATTAVVVASAAVLAACNPSTPSASSSPSAGASPAVAYAAGDLLLSDGTANVRIGTRTVTFPSTVTDAVWSPDGSRIAYIDGDGNVATARPDGTGVLVLTEKKDGVTRSHPAWFSGSVLFTEKTAKAVNVMQTSANGHTDRWRDTAVYNGVLGSDSPESGNSSPSAMSNTGLFAGTGEIAFQHAGSKGPEVWVLDVNQREPWGLKAADGTEPAVSPDGKAVAYVAKNGQISVIANQDKAKPTQISFGAASPTHLTWTPDGKSIAYATKTGVESIAAKIPAGAKENKPQSVASTPGVPSFLPAAVDRVDRVTGADPVALSISASQARWPKVTEFMQTQDTRPAGSVVIASAAKPELALAAAQLTGAAHGPLLLTSGTTLDAAVKAELQRVLGKVKDAYGQPTIFVVGGTDVLSAQVDKDLKALHYQVQRVSGKDAAALAAAAATASVPAESAAAVAVVSSDDTAAIAEASTLEGVTVLYANGATLPDAAQKYLNKLYADGVVYPIGDKAQQAVAATWPGKNAKLKVKPLTGGSLATVVATTFTASPDVAVLVDPADQLTAAIAASLAHGFGSAVVPVSSGKVDADAQQWLQDSSASVDTVLLVGAVAQAGVDAQVGGWTAGPLGYATGENPVAKM